MKTRPHAEAKVISRNRSDKGLDQGRREKAKKTASRQKSLMAAVKARISANKKNLSTRPAVCGEAKFSFDTVRRATKGLKPRKKMKK